MAESDYQEMLAQHLASMREMEQEELLAASTRIRGLLVFRAISDGTKS